LILIGLTVIDVVVPPLGWSPRLGFAPITEEVMGSFWLSAMFGMAAAVMTAIRRSNDSAFVTIVYRAWLGALIGTGTTLACLLAISGGEGTIVHVLPIALSLFGVLIGRMAWRGATMPIAGIVCPLIGATLLTISPFAAGDPGFGLVPLMLGVVVGVITWAVGAVRRSRA
jgi:hypothetical protein